jgi:hypothetical protein
MRYLSWSGALCALFLLCSCGDDDTPTDCSPPCEAGFVCNPTTKQCEPEKKECTPACQPPQVCDTSTGQCVAPACTPACGANADCTGGSCVCQAGYFDCDADLGQGGNGCECDKPCDQCNAECDENVKGSCVDETKYCEAGSCVSCPQGTRNCDGDNANQCEVTAATCAPPAALADDKCPATTTPVTTSTVINSTTGQKPIPTHCMLTDPFSQVVAIQISAQKQLTFTAEASGAEIVLSLRTQCDVDHGCGIGQDSVTYIRTVDAGTYNLVVATSISTAYKLTITIEDPAP